MLKLLNWKFTMPVTIPITVYVPDLVVRRISTEGDLVVAEYDMGPAPEQWESPALKEEARTVLGFEDIRNEDNLNMYSALMLTMRQPRRVLDGAALTSFLKAARPDGIAAFVHQYGVFKRPKTGLEKITVSIQDFIPEQAKLRALLRMWTCLKDGEIEDASDIAKDGGLEFAGDPRFALSVHVTKKLEHRSTLTFVASDDKLEPILYCRDVLTGLYALLFQAIVAGRPWALCLNCENAFSIGRPGKRFCSERCQQALKQRRYRKAQKRKAKKKFKKKG